MRVNPAWRAPGRGGVAGRTVAAAAPTVTAISPNIGLEAGGESLVITGTGFVSGATVAIGGVSATVISVDVTTIGCIAPAHAAGLVNVVVTTTAGSGTLTNGYTFEADEEEIPPVNPLVIAEDPGTYLYFEAFDTRTGNSTAYPVSESTMIAASAPGSGCSGRDADGYPSAQATYGSNRTIANSNHACDLGTSRARWVTTDEGTALQVDYPSHSGNLGISLLSPWSDTGQRGTALGFGDYMACLFRCKIDPGQAWTPGGTKFLEMQFTGSSQRIQFGPGDGVRFSMVAGANPGNTVNRTVQPIGPYFTDWNDGEWHDILMVYKANTWTTYLWTGGGTSSATEVYSGSSSRDGFCYCAVDGVIVAAYHQSLVGVTPPGGTNVWCTQGDVDWIPARQVGWFQFPEVAVGAQGAVRWTLKHLRSWRPAE